MEVKLAIEDYLMRHGFDLDASPGYLSHRCFLGQLDREGIEPINIIILITDWTLSSYPRIYLQKGERHFSSNHAHINFDNSLCYVAPGDNIVLNSLYPENAIEFCLTSAAKLIARMDSNDPSLLDDYRNEFQAYWLNDFSIVYSYDKLKYFHYLVYMGTKEMKSLWMVPLEHDNQHPLLKNILHIQFNQPVGQAFVIKVGQEWPVKAMEYLPENLYEFLEWFKENSPDRLMRFLELTASPVFWTIPVPTVVIKTPRHSLAVILLADESNSGVTHIHQKERHKFGGLKLYQKDNPLLKIPIKRCHVEDASVAAIHSRNGHPSLSDKTILIIGGGAIGSFLMDALSMVGAGTSKGSITVLDKEQLETGNLTRHSLGIRDLNTSKAEAIKEKINREMPHVNVNSIYSDAQVSLHFGYDLIIDATGEEPFSRWLNKEHLSYLHNGGHTPVIYAWLEGEGMAWRSLLVDSISIYACKECLYIHGENGERELRFPHSREPINYRHVGCKTIVPYAATAAMQAASLACEVAVDWNDGITTPRFRGGQRSGRKYEIFIDHDLPMQNECPACKAI